jgi:hypothetical protein
MLKLKKRFLVATLSLLVVGTNLRAKEWRGITPLHSTREDVVRLFNQCEDPKMDCVFHLGNEQIRIVFSGDESGSFSECPSQLPANTVLLIETKLKTELQLKRLNINKRNFRSFDPSSPPNMGYKGYIDDKKGLILKTYKGRVIQIDYIATVKDKPLCPSYYENPISFIQVGLYTHCPPIAILCPTNNPQAGENVMFSAEIATDPKTNFTWTVSAGRIVNGQGTRVISVDTKGLKGQTIIATVKVSGFCSTGAACAMQISPK